MHDVSRSTGRKWTNCVLLVPSIFVFSGFGQYQAKGGARGLMLAAHSHDGTRNVSGERCSETTTTIAKKMKTPTRFAQSSPDPACPGESAQATAKSRIARLSRHTSTIRPRSADVPFNRARFVGLLSITLSSSVYTQGGLEGSDIVCRTRARAVHLRRARCNRSQML